MSLSLTNNRICMSTLAAHRFLVDITHRAWFFSRKGRTLARCFDAICVSSDEMKYGIWKQNWQMKLAQFSKTFLAFLQFFIRLLLNGFFQRLQILGAELSAAPRLVLPPSRVISMPISLTCSPFFLLLLFFCAVLISGFGFALTWRAGLQDLGVNI